MTETPEEMYKRLQTFDRVGDYYEDDLLKLLNHYRNQVQVLREAIETQISALIVAGALGMIQVELGRSLEKEMKKQLAATKDKWGE